MPYGWIEPDVFLTHNGVTVYRAYKDEQYDRPMSSWYMVSADDVPDLPRTAPLAEALYVEFDVRSLPGVRDGHAERIKLAIDRGDLPARAHKYV